VHRVTRAALLVVAALVGFAIVNGAYGWLYLMGPSSWLPGPRVADALPLDELSGHAAMPLLEFLGVWAVAALLLGLLARVLRLERLNAALFIALAVGFWAYLETGASIAIVRQIAAEDAFRAAAAVRAVYIPAAVVGIVAALVGRARPTARLRTPVIFASLTVVAGLLGLLDAILPERSETLLARLAPGAHPLARSLEGPLALALLYVAPGLARRRRRAWQLAVALLAGATVLHVLHSDYGAVFTGLLTVALVSRRDAFDASGDPRTKRGALGRGALLLVAIYSYGAAAFWGDRAAAGRPFSAAVAVRDTSRALVGLGLRDNGNGGFDRWLALSVLVLGLVAAASLVHVWLAPWRYRLKQETRERRVARALVHDWGADTLAPFVLRTDKSYFFSADERAFLAYRVVGGVAIVSSDPIGPPAAFGPLLDRFIEFARERDWRVAVLGASEASLELYRGRGLRAFYHGDEAVVDVARFSLEGRPIRKVRQSVHRLQRSRYTALVLHPRELDPELRAELEHVAKVWRGDEPERGFVMALDALFRLEGEDAVFVVGVGPDGSAEGFLHFAIAPAAQALSLSSMPRLPNTPNGFNEWLVCEAVEWARAHGIPRVSLNFSPFAALLTPEADLSKVQKLEAKALRALKWHFQLDNLLLFNRKFFPDWQRRFVVYEHRRDLPRVGVAALAAEAYLPFPRRAAEP
jgi:lysyl-tRNA synthetase, class II